MTALTTAAKWVFGVLASLLLALPAAAQAVSAPAVTTPQATTFWRASAIADVQAAYALLRDDHPGASPALGDAAFVTTLEAAHGLAAQRARQVTSFQGYAATLAGFANAFGDKHVRSRPFLQLYRPDWAGVIIGKRGDHWMVVDAEDGAPEAALVGRELVSCDGRTPDDWGRELMGGFRADWSADAQKVQTAPWLLISEGNPFVPRPASCVFAKAGDKQTMTLTWRPVSRQDLDVRLAKDSTFGAAGFGVRRAGAGYWIALQSLSASATPVVDQVKAEVVDMRQAPFIVLDLRGNGGGSTIFSDQIAEQILGKPYVEAVTGEDDTCGGDTFRVSDGVIATFQTYLATGFPSRDPQVVAYITQALHDLQAAKAAGHAFSGPLTCPLKPKAAAAPAYKGKLYLLTDGLCFSACLATVSNWLSLGAVQLGQPTDANTYFTDVHDVVMPSGLSTFSTMMAINVGGTPRLGPFTPLHLYDGDIADTAKVEAWAVALASQP